MGLPRIAIFLWCSPTQCLEASHSPTIEGHPIGPWATQPHREDSPRNRSVPKNRFWMNGKP